MQAWMCVLSLAPVACLFSTLALADAAEPPTLVPSPVEKVFVALGFDDNDDIELMIHGHFPNTCYKVGPISATLNTGTGAVEISAQSYRYHGGCAQLIVNFTQSVKVGLLRQGSYYINVNGQDGLQTAPLVVAQAATASPDDYLYAPVAEASLDEAEDGSYAVTIKGEYPYMLVGCMVLREVRTYVSPGNTIVVLPIAELVEGEACDAQAATHKFAVSKAMGALPQGEYLIHVRVLEGNSLNRFVELY